MRAQCSGDAVQGPKEESGAAHCQFCSSHISCNSQDPKGQQSLTGILSPVILGGAKLTNEPPQTYFINLCYH